MDREAEFQSLMDRLRARDPAAVAEAYRRYGPAVRVAVRRHLARDLRAEFDSLDFAQDVWATFLATPADRYTFQTPAALLGFLDRVARNKVIDAARRRAARGRSPSDRDPPTAGELVSPDPTPCDVAIAGDLWDQLADRVPACYRPVVERLREGYTHDDIARMAGLSPSTVKRIVRRLRENAGL